MQPVNNSYDHVSLDSQNPQVETTKFKGVKKVALLIAAVATVIFLAMALITTAGVGLLLLSTPALLPTFAAFAFPVITGVVLGSIPVVISYIQYENQLNEKKLTKIDSNTE